jgi:hypothetical protein
MGRPSVTPYDSVAVGRVLTVDTAAFRYQFHEPFFDQATNDSLGRSLLDPSLSRYAPHRRPAQPVITRVIGQR